MKIINLKVKVKSNVDIITKRSSGKKEVEKLIHCRSEIIINLNTNKISGTSREKTGKNIR